MEPTYSDFIGGLVPGLIDPQTTRGYPSDGELKARRLRREREAATTPIERNVRGLDSWTVWGLDAINAPLQGSGKNGAWTKADFEALCA